ncbi:phage baseplate assembly protein V [Methylopila sp. M107]|uniref:phage baseplate assembly protein V n=1 Tax=Methylopila sp. M107 TaxID=1101190 RepID=UPI0003806FF2|nr:phage baseplate assembly protein V [Methylopila sp. M107]
MPAELALVEQSVRQQQTHYYGKYRAFVADNKDPEKLGRVKLTVPSVLGGASTEWAFPVTPYGGAAGIGFFAVPPVGAQVVAEFMEGDVSAPLWTGSFWRLAKEVPKEATGSEEPTVKLLKTESGHLFSLEDKSGDEKVTLQSAAGATLELDHEGTIALTDKNGATVKVDAKAGEIRIEDKNGNALVLSSAGISATDGSGNEISTSASGVKVSGATIEVKGQSVVVGGAGGEPLVKGPSFMAIFNAHTHNCTAPGAPSGPPLTPLTPGAFTTATVAS